MKKITIVTLTLVVVAIGLATVRPRNEEAELINAVNTAYEKAQAGEQIEPKETWRIEELYTPAAIGSLSSDEHAALNRKIKVVALSYIEQVAEQAGNPEKVVTYDETWGAAPLYEFAVEGMTEDERDRLDDKLYLIADAYYQHQYESKAPANSDHGEGIDDNGWKANIRSAFIPRAKELRGDAPAGAWAGPKD